MQALPRIGVDSEPIARFMQPDLRLFTAAEIELAREAALPAEFFAGRWCAKEAVVKAAWPFVRLSPRDVEVLRDADGRPVASLLLQPLDSAALHVDVSITHDGARATAVAVVVPIAPTQ